MAAIKAQMPELQRMGVRVLAASTDSEENAFEIAEGYNIPVACGVTKQDAEKIGAFTGERRGELILQATEFVLRPGGEVAASLYSTTQLGRMNPEEVVRFIQARMDR